jgi:DNA modification methylase
MSFLLTTDRRILDYIKHRYDQAHATSLPYADIQHFADNVYNYDVCQFLRELPDKSVDFIFTDEPYGVAPTRLNLKARTDITTDFEWDKIIELPEVYKDLLYGISSDAPRLPAHLLNEWVFEASRVLKDTGMLVNFGSMEFVATFRDVVRYAGMTWRASIPWLKTNTAPHFRKANFRSGHETIFFASKGKTKGVWNFMEQQEMVNFIIDQTCPKCHASFPVILSNNYDTPNWFEKVQDWTFEISPMTNKKSPHPTEKPEWLITKYMEIMSKPGDVVVDCFAGSGVIPSVAKKLGRRYIVNDKDEYWTTYIQKRLKNQQLSF